jgi:hypothetical protein
MPELTFIRCWAAIWRARLAEMHGDERGEGVVTTVLMIAGFAILAVAVVAAVTAVVNRIMSTIPDSSG